MAKVATKTTQRQRCPIKVKSSNGVQNNCLAATVSNKIVLSPIRRTNEEDDCYTKLLFSFIVQKTSGKPSMRYTFVARYTFIAHCNLRTPFTSSSNQTPCFILYTVHSSMLYSTKISSSVSISWSDLIRVEFRNSPETRQRVLAVFQSLPAGRKRGSSLTN